MIHTQLFASVAAAVTHFNLPEHARLRLVSVLPPLPPATDYTAIYDELSGPQLTLEEERLRILEERILVLWQLDDATKVSMGVPQSILADSLIPLSLVNNKLRGYAPFKGLDTPARAEWIRDRLGDVSCSLVPRAVARARHGCAAELIEIEG